MRSDLVEQLRDGLLTLRNSYAGTSYCMRLSGELDLENVASFAAEITRMEDSGAEQMVVDLSQLEFIDPSGMAALANAARRFGAAGRQLHLLGEPRRFARHGENSASVGRYAAHADAARAGGWPSYDGPYTGRGAEAAAFIQRKSPH